LKGDEVKVPTKPPKTITEVIHPEVFVCCVLDNELQWNVCLKDTILRIPLMLEVFAPCNAPERAMQKAVVNKYQLRTSLGVSASASKHIDITMSSSILVRYN
jgi:hypothetical protein